MVYTGKTFQALVFDQKGNNGILQIATGMNLEWGCFNGEIALKTPEGYFFKDRIAKEELERE